MMGRDLGSISVEAEGISRGRGRIAGSAFGGRPAAAVRATSHMKPLAGLGLLLLAAGASSTAGAEPAFARMYKQAYGYTPSCNACHKDGGGTPLNAYGHQFKDAGMGLAAFETIAGLDADGDGHRNGDEARAKSNPGSERSTPAAPGPWLDTQSLIPREVLALFPGVRTWLPKDAILTEAEVARAAAMGVDLGHDTENTIYIPVENRRPIGTALIFPARYDGRDFFLLMATDRNLKVTRVQPLNTRLVPEARGREIYESFIGLALDQLPEPTGDDIDAAITEAVRKAGTLVWVRLKGA